VNTLEKLLIAAGLACAGAAFALLVVYLVAAFYAKHLFQ
jgi:hypothetical protein